MPFDTSRINRYIMECKYKCNSNPTLMSGFELIDTLWNVNQTGTTVLLQQERELIDTLWNVNLTSKQAEYLQGCELIDTLWNVN